MMSFFVWYFPIFLLIFLQKGRIIRLVWTVDLCLCVEVTSVIHKNSSLNFVETFFYFFVFTFLFLIWYECKWFELIIFLFWRNKFWKIEMLVKSEWNILAIYSISSVVFFCFFKNNISRNIPLFLLCLYWRRR